MKREIKNIKDLRENLIESLETFCDGGKSDTEMESLNSISKASSAIIRSAKVELEYAKYKGLTTDIDFLKA